LTNGKRYGFAVASYKGDEKSDLVGKIYITPEDLTPPAPPKGLRSYSGKRYVKLTWNPSLEKDFLHYTVYRRRATGGEMRILEEDTGITIPEFTDYNLRSGTLYVYGVTATDRFGNESKLSKTVEGHTKFPSRITFKENLKLGKLYSYCYNPNDRSVYMASIHTKEMKKWSMWRRIIFHFPNPPGKIGWMNRLMMVRYKNREVRAVTIYPQNGEVYVCYKEGMRWKGWSLYSNKLLVPPYLLSSSVSYDVIYQKDKLIVATYDYSTNSFTLFIPDKKKKYSKIRWASNVVIPKGELKNFSFSILDFSNDRFKALFLFTGTGNGYIAEIKRGKRKIDNLKLCFSTYTLPPDF
jgi:hypothetical protein